MSGQTYSVGSVGDRIDGFLRPLLKQAGFKLDFEMADGDSAHSEFETPDIVVKFTGHDVDLLLANKAEVLLALEHLTQEMLRMPSEHHSRVSFDANDYRLLRIEELRLSAATAAEKVKRSGVPFRFNPMNSRERRVIHLALRNEAGVRSESAGVGPQRQVVIYPAGMPSIPDDQQQAQHRPGRRQQSRGARR